MVSSWKCSLEAIPEQIPEILIRNNSWKASGLPSDLSYFQETSEPSASYKKQIVFPALSAKDDIEFQRASNKQFYKVLGCTFRIWFLSVLPSRVGLAASAVNPGGMEVCTGVGVSAT